MCNAREYKVVVFFICEGQVIWFILSNLLFCYRYSQQIYRILCWWEDALWSNNIGLTLYGSVLRCSLILVDKQPSGPTKKKEFSLRHSVDGWKQDPSNPGLRCTVIIIVRAQYKLLKSSCFFGDGLYVSKRPLTLDLTSVLYVMFCYPWPGLFDWQGNWVSSTLEISGRNIRWAW